MGHDPKQLDAKVDEIKKIVGIIGDGDYWQELTGIWRHPGWTTPAEWLLVSGHLESLQGALEQARQSQESLMAGCRAVQSKG